MGAYRVTAPFVTLKVKDASGQTVVQGYYLDGVVNNPVKDEQFDKHVRNGWLEKAGDAPAPEAAPEPESDEPEAPAKPHGNAGRDAWVNYALESGQASEDEVKDLSRDDLRDLYGN